MASATDIVFNLEAIIIFLDITYWHTEINLIKKHRFFIILNLTKILLSAINLFLAQLIIIRIKKIQKEKVEESLKIVNDKSEKLKIVTMGFENGSMFKAGKLIAKEKEDEDKSSNSDDSNDDENEENEDQSKGSLSSDSD